MDRILAIDPGNTIGWCLIEGRSVTHYSEFHGNDFGEIVDEINYLLETLSPTVVVYEKFALYPWKALKLGFDELLTVQVIGAIRALCHQRDIPTVAQQPSIKYLWSDERLRLQGFVVKGIHAKDALRHCLHYWNKMKSEG